MKRWMRENHVSMVWTAEQLGISTTWVRKLLSSESISTDWHARLVELRFPSRLLPLPQASASARGRKKVIPVWLED